MTTIQVSDKVKQMLANKKLRSSETFEDVILDLIEDTMELSEQTKKDIKEAQKDIKTGEVYRWEDVKKELNIDV